MRGNVKSTAPRPWHILAKKGKAQLKQAFGCWKLPIYRKFKEVEKKIQHHKEAQTKSIIWDLACRSELFLQEVNDTKNLKREFWTIVL